jgi:TP901 family phage tail tape measure protein
MSFKAGSITADARLNTKNFDSGIKGMLKGATMAGAAIAAGLTAALGAAVAKANEYQKALSNVTTLTDQSTAETVAMSKALLQLDPALGSTTDLTNGLYQAISAGAETTEQAMQITKDSAMFAKAALTDTATAVDVLTTASNAYGSDVVSSEHAANVFFTTIREGKVTGEELASTIGQSIPLFASLNVPLEELSAGLATMTKQGVNSANATTQLNAIMNSFLKPSGEMSEALQRMGYESGAAFIEAEGLSGAMEFLQEESQGSADKLAGLLPNTRALRGAMALSGQGAEIFAETMEAMGDTTGTVEEAFAKQEKTFETFQNSAGQLQIVVGNIGKSFVDEWAKGASQATQSMTQFIMSSQFMNIVAETVGYVSGAFAALTEAAKPIVDAIGPALAGLAETLTKNFGESTGQVDLAQMAFQAMGLAAQGVAAGIAVLGKFIEGVITNIANMTKAITASVDVLGAFFEGLSDPFKEGAFDKFGESLDSAGEAWTNMGVGMVEGMGGIIDEVITQFESFEEGAKQTTINVESAFTGASDNMKNHITSNWALMVTGAKTAGEEMGEVLTAGITGDGAGGTPPAEGVEEEMNEVLKVINEYTTKIEEVFSNWQIGAVWDELWGGLTAIEAQELQNQSAELALAHQRDLEALDARLAEGLITEEEYATLKEQVDADNLKKKNELEKKQFEASKRNRIAEVAISAAGSIMEWWKGAAALGPIAGPAFAGTMTAATLGLAGAQIAAISQEQFVPAFATGGTHSGGPAMINENGGEIVNLPDGTVIVPNDISKMIAQNSGGGEVNISLAGANFTDSLNSDRIVERLKRELGQQMRRARA